MECIFGTSACAKRESWKTGRLIIGLLAILSGLQIYSYGHATYDESLHDLRKTYMPDTLSTSALCSGTKITWEELNRYAIQGEAALFILSGVCIMLNFKCLGSFLLTIAVSFIIIVKDLPWIRHSTLKTYSKERNDRLIDLLKNLSMLGAAFLIMADKGNTMYSSNTRISNIKVEEKSKEQVSTGKGKNKKNK